MTDPCWEAFEQYALSRGGVAKRDSSAWRCWEASWEASRDAAKETHAMMPRAVSRGMQSEYESARQYYGGHSLQKIMDRLIAEVEGRSIPW